MRSSTFELSQKIRNLKVTNFQFKERKISSIDINENLQFKTKTNRIHFENLFCWKQRSLCSRRYVLQFLFSQKLHMEVIALMDFAHFDVLKNSHEKGPAMTSTESTRTCSQISFNSLALLVSGSPSLTLTSWSDTELNLIMNFKLTLTNRLKLRFPY